MLTHRKSRMAARMTERLQVLLDGPEWREGATIV
jgi:hypothetical protein